MVYSTTTSSQYVGKVYTDMLSKSSAANGMEPATFGSE